MTLIGSVMRVVNDQRDRLRLRRMAPLACDVSQLRSLNAGWLQGALRDPGIGDEWPALSHEIGELGITASAQGVNPGDRRALYYLLRALRPQQVLEVGTHIGASTVHIAAALRASGPRGELTTVDVVDVNDAQDRPWMAAGAQFSPAELMTRIGMASRVRFVTQPSLAYLANGDQRFDVIFLDGDHSGATVYRELPAALRRLEPEGVVILHDYYPGGRRLWPGAGIIVGPWLATERLRGEGCPIEILPLGDLPWPTKLGTNTTSLALASRAS